MGSRRKGAGEVQNHDDSARRGAMATCDKNRVLATPHSFSHRDIFQRRMLKPLARCKKIIKYSTFPEIPSIVVCVVGFMIYRPGARDWNVPT